MPNLEDFNNDFNAFNNALIDEFRNDGGKVTGMFAGVPLVLITTTGAKTARRRTTPIVYTTDGDHIVIIASKGGAPTSPDWYHNLVAHPEVTVELPGKAYVPRDYLGLRRRVFDFEFAPLPQILQLPETDRIMNQQARIPLTRA